MEIGIPRAKAELSKLIKAALAGNRVVITNGGEAQVKLIPVLSKKPRTALRGYGAMPGLLEKLPPNWDSTSEG